MCAVFSLKERNRRAVETAQVKEKQDIMEELTELEHHVLCLPSSLESCPSQRQQQVSSYLSGVFDLCFKHHHKKLYWCSGMDL